MEIEDCIRDTIYIVIDSLSRCISDNTDVTKYDFNSTITLVIAFVALIIGPIVQMKIVRANLLSTERQRLVSNFKGLVGSFLSYSLSIHDTYTKVTVTPLQKIEIITAMQKLKNQILFIIPQQNSIYNNLKTSLSDLIDVSKNVKSDDYEKKCMEIMNLSQKIIEYQQNKINKLK